MNRPRRRALGTMIAYGFPRVDVEGDLAIAARLGATHLEILPDWRALPDPEPIRNRVRDLGLIIHSAHGCWGGQAITADRVDLGDPDPRVAQASRDDLKRCLDWLGRAGGRHLVVHPGGLSEPEQTAERRDVLAEALSELADHAAATGIRIGVENMPPGVHPGSRMADLADLLKELGRPELGLALDTGHAHLVSNAAEETIAAGSLLATTHVHDNNGRSDTHEPPGTGTARWNDWLAALDAIDYRGPIMLECIRHLRTDPRSLNPALFGLLDRLTGRVS